MHLESELKEFIFNHGLSPPTFANHKKSVDFLVHKKGKEMCKATSQTTLQNSRLTMQQTTAHCQANKAANIQQSCQTAAQLKTKTASKTKTACKTKEEQKQHNIIHKNSNLPHAQSPMSSFS